jgi:thioredoxin-like negative regulator of GroEL
MPEHRLHEKPICGICGRAIVSGETSKILEVDDASFPREVLHYTGAVVVICRSDLDNTEYSLSIDPLFERLIDQYAYGVKAARLEISKNHLMAAQYNIRSAPTILFFKGGQLLHALAENLSREEIERHLSAIAEID